MADFGPKHRPPVSEKRAAENLLEQMRRLLDIYGAPSILAAMAHLHSEEASKQRSMMHIRQSEEEYHIAVALRNCAERLKRGLPGSGGDLHPLSGLATWGPGQKH